MQHLPDSYSPPDPDKPESRRTLEHFTGCLLGGAVGDALGAPERSLRIGCQSWNCARRSRRWRATCSSSSRTRKPGGIVTLDRND